MSLNQIVSQDFKSWMDPYVNSIKIDENWSYKEGGKAEDDYLILDNSLIAEWGPIPLNTPVGNAFAARLNSRTVNSSPTQLSYVVLGIVSAFYDTSGSTIILKEAGKYLIYVNVAFNSNIGIQKQIKLQLEDPSNTYLDVVGSNIASPPGCTSFSSTAPYTQTICLTNTCFVETTVANRGLRIFAWSTSAGSLVTSQSSYVTIYRIE